MLRIVSACIAVFAGFAAPSTLAQSYPDSYGGGDYGGGAPTLILPDGYGATDSSHDNFGNSEAVPADIVAPDGAPDGEESHAGDEGGH
jgi:hypothetical protein